MDPAAVVTVGLSVLQVGILAGIFFRLGALGTRQEDHGRRLEALEQRKCKGVCDGVVEGTA